MHRRLMSGLLVFTMVFQLCAGTAYAAEKEDVTHNETDYEQSSTENDEEQASSNDSTNETYDNIVHTDSTEASENANDEQEERTTESEEKEEIESESESEETIESITESETESEETIESTLESTTESEIEQETESEIDTDEDDEEEEEAFEEGDPDFLFQAGGFQVMDTSGDGISLQADGDMDRLSDEIYIALKDRAESIDIRSYGFQYDNTEDRNQLLMLFYAIVNDHPDLYYVQTGYGVSYLTNSKTITKISPNYYKNMDDSAFWEGVQRAKSVVSSDMDDLQKAIAFHDYIVLNCEYDKERLSDGTMPNESYGAYGVLVNQIAVCQGYTLAYKYLLNEYGIDCYIVTSDRMNHAWNIVRIGDVLYQVDLTWDDPVWDRYGLVSHAYMFQSDEEWRSSHRDWYVTKGSGIVDIQAESTTYDNAFWKDVKSPLVYDNSAASRYYYVSNRAEDEGELQSRTISRDGIGEADTLKVLDTPYSGLVLDDVRLYYNTSSTISYININDADYIEQVRYTLDESDTNKIFGFTRSGNTIQYVKDTKYENKAKREIYVLDDSKDIATETEKGGYFVTFIDDFGTVFDKLPAKSGGYVNPPKEITPPDGYNFSYWKGVYSNVQKDETVTAVYTKISYTVSYVLNGGENSSSNITKYDVETSIILENPTKNGYDFDGWYEDADFETRVTMVEKGSTGNRTFYAKWVPTKYTISYELGGGENSSLNPAEYTIETDTIQLEEPTREYYTFGGWYTGSDYETAVIEIEEGSTGDRIFYAKWNPIVYRISYMLTEGTNIRNYPTEYTVETPDIVLESPAREHYNFNGWYTEPDFLTKVDTIRTGSGGDINLYAKWQRKKVYQVRFLDNTGSLLAQSEVEEGDSANAPRPNAQKGYEFVSWDKDYTNIQNNLDIRAVYTPVQYKITYELGGASNASGNPSAYTIETAKLNLAAPSHSDTSLVFDGWYRDKDFQEEITAIEKGTTGDITVYAKWENIWPVNIKTNKGIIIEEMVVSYKRGKVQKPIPTVIWNGKKLTNKKDFTVSYTGSPSNVGEYTVTVTGKGDFTGTATTSLKILDNTNQTRMSTVKIASKIPAQIYKTDGNKVYDSMVTLKSGTTQLVAGRDYEFVQHEYNGTGTHYVVIRGIGDKYIGEITTTFQVKPYPISSRDVTVQFEQGGNTQPYEKKGARPKVAVSYGGKTLTEGVDYSLSYKNNTKAGKSALVTITGKNDFNAKRTLSFTVGAGKIDDASITVTVPDKVVSNKAGGYVSIPVLTDTNGNKLTAGKDYTVNVVYQCDGQTLNKKTDKVTAGKTVTAEINITGKGNYSGTQNGIQSYRIIAANRNLSKAKVTVNNKHYDTGGRVILQPEELTVMMGGVVLSKNDYEILENTYINNDKKGTAKVTIQGKGEYGGTKTVSFKIYAQK